MVKVRCSIADRNSAQRLVPRLGIGRRTCKVGLLAILRSRDTGSLRVCASQFDFFGSALNVRHRKSLLDSFRDVYRFALTVKWFINSSR
jgi:hypothetical protein